MKNMQHEQTKKKLKIIGFILLGSGSILTVIGFISFFSAFNGGGFPSLFWCAMIGLPLLGFGGMITSLAFRREIARYIKNESTPIINEASQDLAPAIKNVVSAVKQGLEEEKDKNFCTACGAKLDPLDRFCGQCGTKLG